MTQHIESKTSKWWVAAAAAVVLLAGGLLAWWMIVQADFEMRADLLDRTQVVAQALNAPRLRSLAGAESDLDNVEYQRIKKQMSDMRSAIPQCRFLYLLGRNPLGEIFFFVDSEAADSADYSPPGQLYAEASEAAHRIFSTHTAVVDGPATDRWGTWVSGLVPIHDPQAVPSGLTTPDDARSLVQQAIGFYKQQGKELFLQELNNPKGKFHKGDLYAFAYASDMTMLAHPVNPALVGRNLLDKKDWVGGKYFRKEIQEVAQSQRGGWVDYEYENPSNKAIEPKTTYVQGIDDLIICAGAYKDAGAKSHGGEKHFLK